MIVVVDDNADARLLAQQYLTIGFDRKVPVVTVDATEWRSLDWDRVVVAIVDLMMAPEDGNTILAWLKENHPHVKRVAWSAAVPRHGASVPIVERARTLADAIISKPDLELLAEAIEEWQ